MFRPGLDGGFWRKTEPPPQPPEKPQERHAEKRGVCRDSQGKHPRTKPRAAQQRRRLAACAGSAEKTTHLDRRRGGGTRARAGVSPALWPPRRLDSVRYAIWRRAGAALGLPADNRAGTKKAAQSGFLGRSWALGSCPDSGRDAGTSVRRTRYSRPGRPGHSPRPHRPHSATGSR